MNKRGEMGVGGFVLLFIGVVVILALMSPIFNSQAQMTDKSTTSNQSVSTVTAYVDDDDVNESKTFTILEQDAKQQAFCDLSSVAVRNGAGTALTLDTDYELDATAGTFNLLNTSKTIPSVALNLTYVDYTFCGDGYVYSSGGRSVAGIIGVFSALALLGFVLYQSKIWEMFRV